MMTYITSTHMCFWFYRKAATKVEWRFTEQGERVRQVYPSQVILRPTKQQYTLPDGVDPATYMRK